MEWFAQIDWTNVALWFGAIALIVAGFAGTIVPAIPGLPMIAVAAWLIALTDNYETVGWGTIGFLSVLAIIGIVVDSLAQTVGAQKAGASKEGIIGSVIGTFVGMFMGGLIGLLVMPLVGAAIGEFYAKRDLIHAGKVGVATWIGMIVGTVIKIALACTMTGTLFFVYFVG